VWLNPLPLLAFVGCLVLMRRDRDRKLVVGLRSIALVTAFAWAWQLTARAITRRRPVALLPAS
jgi:hypothetical protein